MRHKSILFIALMALSTWAMAESKYMPGPLIVSVENHTGMLGGAEFSPIRVGNMLIEESVQIMSHHIRFEATSFCTHSFGEGQEICRIEFSNGRTSYGFYDWDSANNKYIAKKINYLPHEKYRLRVVDERHLIFENNPLYKANKTK